MATKLVQLFPNEDLWVRLQGGDAAAVSLLFRKHYRCMYNYGYKISRDSSLTKDCIQDIFAELWEKRATLPHVTQTNAYLLKYLRRRIFHSLGQSSRLSSFFDPEGHPFGFELSQEHVLVEEQVSLETKARLNTALQKLSPRQREVIYLRFYDGLSCEAISDITTLKYQSVVNLVHEAIKKLREHVVFQPGY